MPIEPAAASPLSDQTVLVTGGGGFLGKAIVRRLVADGARKQRLLRHQAGVHGAVELPAHDAARPMRLVRLTSTASDQARAWADGQTVERVCRVGRAARRAKAARLPRPRAAIPPGLTNLPIRSIDALPISL